MARQVTNKIREYIVKGKQKTAIVVCTASVGKVKSRWTLENTARDALFLEKLGVPSAN